MGRLEEREDDRDALLVVARDGVNQLWILAKGYPDLPRPYRAFAAAAFIRTIDDIPAAQLCPGDVWRLKDPGLVRRFIRSYVKRLMHDAESESVPPARTMRSVEKVMVTVLSKMTPAARRVLGTWPPEAPPSSQNHPPDASDEARCRLVVDRAIRSDERYRRYLAHLKAKTVSTSTTIGTRH